VSKKNFIKLFIFIAIAEGISFLFLLFIAMPLKYYNDTPQAVKFGGMAHGLLFVAFVMMSWSAMVRLNKNYKWFFFSFFLSILPFGTFYLDKQLRQNQ
jgi:integral membrane protein